MRTLLLSAAALLLCSCAGDANFHSGAMVNGQPMPSFDLTSPQFYMDDDDAAAGSRGTPPQRQFYQGYCPYCP